MRESQERKKLLHEAKDIAKGTVLKEVIAEAKRDGRRGRGFQRFIRAVGRGLGKAVEAAVLKRIGL